ncbi:hypothetical protein QBC45DRAFT_340727, partial [Copromyces sp. CBS 386.78]
GYEWKTHKGKWEKQSERSQGTHALRGISHINHQHFKVLGARPFLQRFFHGTFPLFIFLFVHFSLLFPCSSAFACQFCCSHISFVDGI